MIENGKPMGVILTMEEFENLTKEKEPGSLFSESNKIVSDDSSLFKSENSLPIATAIDDFGIGEAMLKEMDFPNVKMDDLDFASSDDITLEDLGLDEVSE